MTDYTSVTTELKYAYDERAEVRDRSPVQEWKVELWSQFLRRLQAEGMHSLLEIGAGTGQAARFFQDAGLKVVCTDLSSEMVRLCRAKGLVAHEMDFLCLDFPDGKFDGLFAQNCLLHVPKSEFGRVLEAIRRVVRPEGLLFVGAWGGQDFEGVWEDDGYDPKRFYALYKDEEMRLIMERYFRVLSFQILPMEGHRFGHFQAITLRNLQ